MANFLNTLKAWGESLFTVKKSWIGEQSCVYQLYSEKTTTATGDYVNVVAPVTGFSSISIEGNTTGNIRLLIGTKGLYATSFKLTGGLACQYVPCKKGDNVSYLGAKGTQCKISFFKSIGSA